jgi:hypothetical protein
MKRQQRLASAVLVGAAIPVVQMIVSQSNQLDLPFQLSDTGNPE